MVLSRVARETVRSALDDGGGRQVRGDARTGPSHRSDGPGDQRQSEDKHHRAGQACRQGRRQERQGHEPVEREPGNDGKSPCKRWPNDDLSGFCRVTRGGTVPQGPCLCYLALPLKILPKLQETATSKIPSSIFLLPRFRQFARQCSFNLL
jgi:hypothetical protein